MSRPRILIVGASIAGPATAFWLARAGCDVVVAEQATHMRQGGNGVDIREQALDVAAHMGLMEPIRAGATHPAGMRFVDDLNRERARLDARAMQAAIGTEDIEIPRGDLARILFEASRETVEYRFDETVVALSDDLAGVEVTFSRHPPERFDVVIGADGLHSRIRKLVFGPESQFLSFKQHYFATATAEAVPGLGTPEWVTFYNLPGRSVALYRPKEGRVLINYLFRSTNQVAYDHHDIPTQRALVREAFAQARWQVPHLLDLTEQAADFYFDSLSQIRMNTWSKGRVVLVGDAAACASPASGAGALLALVGAYRLAGELASTPDVTTALQRYEAAHRPLVTSKQATLFTGLSVPRTSAGIWLRNLAVRSPLLGLLSRLTPPRPTPLAPYEFHPGPLT